MRSSAVLSAVVAQPVAQASLADAGLLTIAQLRGEAAVTMANCSLIRLALLLGSLLELALNIPRSFRHSIWESVDRDRGVFWIG